ncbi:MAG: manganese efflux pump MntP family protein [Defluviitaleaceae bacterium]|nr:manganese efflux pump MntP family protein [Defluviitaleaceae bacterium]
MPTVQLFLLAIGLSMDAFAVAVTLGLGVGKATWRNALVVGLYFGAFQAGMPLVGFFAAQGFAGYIRAFDTYVVFVLLVFLGGKMIHGAIGSGSDTPAVVSLAPRIMLPFALATSIDAMAVGISFAFLEVNVAAAVLLIGAVTLVISMAGVRIGSFFGERFKTKATVAGGLILIFIGVKVLVEGFL